MKTTAIAAGALLVLAIAAIATVGLQVAKSTQSSSSVLASGTASGTLSSTTASSLEASSSTTSSGAQSKSSSTQSTSASSRSTNQQESSGDFAMMATDPPVVASGVTAATATYSSLAVHTAGDSNSTGWVELNGTGTVNLMSSANVSQTIAAAKVQSGTYDMLRMGIQSAAVTYQGQAYSAAVASGNITTKLQSDAQVSASQSTAAVMDLRTFVMNTGSSANPQFVFSACAKATTVPPGQVASASLQVGAQTQLQGSWWMGFQDQTSTNVTITSATLTSGSLDLQLKNTGNDSAHIQTVVITPVASGGLMATASLPASMSGSAIFTVNSTGSLQASNSLQGAVLLSGNSSQLAAGSSTSIDYSGSISLGFGVVGIQLSGVVSGQQYLVTVMGQNTFGSAVVTAQ
jgi:trimeric autotransporter adhesin